MAHKKTLTYGAILVALAAIVGLSSVTLAATGSTSSTTYNNPHKKIDSAAWEAKSQQIKAKFQAEQSALDKSDYQAWLIAVGPDSAEAKVITADKFPQLVEANKLAEQGRTLLAQAQKLRQDLGLTKLNGLHRQAGRKPLTASSTPGTNN